MGVHDLRAFTHDRHRTVDDRPFGGGEGMVLKAEPLAEALASLGVKPKEQALFSSQRLEEETIPAKGTGFSPYIQPVEDTGALAPAETPATAPTPRPTVVLLSAQGRRFTQATAREFARLDRVVLICGRYEGVDERINQLYCDMELSIGDYILSGGELAAAVVVDATMRLIPGVLGNEASGEFESFGVADAEITSDTDGVPRSQHGAGGLLDYPHYTRPAEFGGLPRARSPDERRPQGDSSLAARAAVAQDPGQPARSVGGRGVERGRPPPSRRHPTRPTLAADRPQSLMVYCCGSKAMKISALKKAPLNPSRRDFMLSPSAIAAAGFALGDSQLFAEHAEGQDAAAGTPAGSQAVHLRNSRRRDQGDARARPANNTIVTDKNFTVILTVETAKSARNLSTTRAATTCSTFWTGLLCTKWVERRKVRTAPGPESGLRLSRRELSLTS